MTRLDKRDVSDNIPARVSGGSDGARWEGNTTAVVRGRPTRRRSARVREATPAIAAQRCGCGRWWWRRSGSRAPSSGSGSGASPAATAALRWASRRSAPRPVGARRTRSRSRTRRRRPASTLKFSDAQQKQENQIKAIRSYIQQKVDVIAFSPVIESGWDAVLNEAKRANIPVILTDRAVDSKDTTPLQDVHRLGLRQGGQQGRRVGGQGVRRRQGSQHRRAAGHDRLAPRRSTASRASPTSSPRIRSSRSRSPRPVSSRARRARRSWRPS